MHFQNQKYPQPQEQRKVPAPSRSAMRPPPLDPALGASTQPPRLAPVHSAVPLLLVGHRGHRLQHLGQTTQEAENSLAAFHRAYSAGLGGLELDIRGTLDGHLVVHHNARLGRRLIAATALQDLRRLQPHLATLPEVLRAYGPRCWLDLELKAPGSEQLLVQLLRRRPPRRGFVVSSFEPSVLRRLAALEPTLPLCWNLSSRQPLRWPRVALACVAAHERRVTASFLRTCRRRHLPVLAWTVNRPRRMRQLAALGVAGILSDHPALLAATLASSPGRAS
jgi:glycerophosphoryl diester phosphodiesterase